LLKYLTGAVAYSGSGAVQVWNHHCRVRSARSRDGRCAGRADQHPHNSLHWRKGLHETRQRPAFDSLYCSHSCVACRRCAPSLQVRLVAIWSCISCTQTHESAQARTRDPALLGVYSLGPVCHELMNLFSTSVRLYRASWEHEPQSAYLRKHHRVCITQAEHPCCIEPCACSAPS
jgi:hypothetical protein